MLCVICGGDKEPVEFELPEDPLKAADLAVRLVDEHNGNVLDYPRVVAKRAITQTTNHRK